MLGRFYNCSPYDFLDRTFDEIAVCLTYTERVAKRVKQAVDEKD